jgi:hypothetical protein
MSFFSSAPYEASPVLNAGYYDVPINDEYSNHPQERDSEIEYLADQAAENIALTINDNKQRYKIKQSPIQPFKDERLLSNENNQYLIKKKESENNYYATPTQHIEPFYAGSPYSSTYSSGYMIDLGNQQYQQQTEPYNRNLDPHVFHQQQSQHPQLQQYPPQQNQYHQQPPQQYHQQPPQQYQQQQNKRISYQSPISKIRNKPQPPRIKIVKKNILPPLVKKSKNDNKLWNVIYFLLFVIILLIVKIVYDNGLFKKMVMR